MNDDDDGGGDGGVDGDNQGDDGGSLQPVWRDAFDVSAIGFISAAWGPSPNNIYFVGGQSDDGKIIHFDGSDYSLMDTPPTSLLVWVFGFSANDVYAVGEQGAALHFDGNSWTTIETGTDQDLFGVWGASTDDLWFVGGEAGTGPLIIMHYDGATVEEVASPDHEPDGSAALLKVWGTANDHVFAIGENGLILRFDGTSWMQEVSGTQEDLVSLWGTGPDNIVAVGGRANAAVLTYDGDQWSVADVSGLAALNGVFMVDPDEAILGGQIGTVARFNPLTGAVALESAPTTETVHGVFGDGSGLFYAVGGRTFVDPFTGILLARTLEPVAAE
jgi:hypothetical protein